MSELKANNKMEMPTKGPAQLPTSDSIAACVHRIASLAFELDQVTEIKIIHAVALQINEVSVITLSICTRPCLTGWLTFAVAAAFGALPSPASLEKRPRLTPCKMAAPIPPPTNSLSPKAFLKIS